MTPLPTHDLFLPCPIDKVWAQHKCLFACLLQSGGCEDVIEHLRGSVEAKDAQGKTPVQLAAYGNHSETIIALSQQGQALQQELENQYFASRELLWQEHQANLTDIESSKLKLAMQPKQHS